MSAFAVVTVVVCAIALAIAAVWFVIGGMGDFNRRGRMWFDHREDIPEADRPSEDDRDAPIPKRPLRGRPE